MSGTINKKKCMAMASFMGAIVVLSLFLQQFSLSVICVGDKYLFSKNHFVIIFFFLVGQFIIIVLTSNKDYFYFVIVFINI